MSLEYCEYCQVNVDTDEDVGHFDCNPQFKCVYEEQERTSYLDELQASHDGLDEFFEETKVFIDNFEI